MTLLCLSARGFAGLKDSVNRHVMSLLRCPLVSRTTAVFFSPRKTAFAYTTLPRFMSMSASAFDAKYENILMSRS
jgi:hypothetical protein